ncbi:hypothetical protein D3C81_1394540 [compost metagenome]
MQAQVNGQRQGLAGLGVFGDLDILDQPAAPVLDDLSFTRHPGQPFVIGQLDTFLAMVIDVGKADHMRGHFTGRIETAELFDAIDARHFEIEHRLALLRRQPAHQINEFLVGLRFKALGQGFRVLPQGSRQCRPLLFGRLHFLGIGPKGGDRSTHGQRLAVTVGDQTTVSRNRNMTNTAGIALTFKEGTVDHLQIDDAPGNRGHHDAEQTQHHAEPPRKECTFEFHHGATIFTSAAPGMCIFNCSVASTSIRLWAVQVLCSRINRPHSACALSRTLNSLYSEFNS